MLSPTEPKTNKFSSKWMFGAVVFGAFLIRGLILIIQPQGLSHDTDGYRNLAETLRQSGVFGFSFPPAVATEIEPVQPTAFRPPLYPLLLSIFVTNGRLSPIAIGALHLICGVLTVALVWVLGEKWGLGLWSLFAAILTACDPISLHQSTQIMTETAATLITVFAFWCLTNWLQQPSMPRILITGIVLGMACLCRPTFLPWSGLVVLFCLCKSGSLRLRLRSAVTLLAGLCVAILPWGLRNYVQFGEMKFTTTHGGYTLLLANNPSFYDFLRNSRWGDVWHAEVFDSAWRNQHRLRDSNDRLLPLEKGQGTRALGAQSAKPQMRDEFQDDQHAYDAARKFIAGNPTMFMYSICYRVGSLWQVLPHQLNPNESQGRRAMRYLVALWYLGIYGCCVAGIWKLKSRLLREPWLWGILLCVTFSAVHSIYWSNMRMRAPLMPFIALLATAGVARNVTKSGEQRVES